jgi:predicted RNA-binding protein with PUA-like domain
MAYWLVKSEPDVYNWSTFVKDKRTHWDGVRNNAAALFLKTMAVGDEVFFYHSGDEKQIVGTAIVAKTAYPDPSDPDGRFVMVDLKVGRAAKQPVTLKQVKADKALATMELVRQSRLSVSPVRPAEWKKIAALAGLD